MPSWTVIRGAGTRGQRAPGGAAQHFRSGRSRGRFVPDSLYYVTLTSLSRRHSCVPEGRDQCRNVRSPSTEVPLSATWQSRPAPTDGPQRHRAPCVCPQSPESQTPGQGVAVPTSCCPCSELRSDLRGRARGWEDGGDHWPPTGTPPVGVSLLKMHGLLRTTGAHHLGCTTGGGRRGSPCPGGGVDLSCWRHRRSSTTGWPSCCRCWGAVRPAAFLGPPALALTEFNLKYLPRT